MKTVVTKHEHRVWGKISDVNHCSSLPCLKATGVKRLKASCSDWSRNSEKVMWWSEPCELSQTGLIRSLWHLLSLPAAASAVFFSSSFKHHVDLASLQLWLFLFVCLFLPWIYCLSCRPCDLDLLPYLCHRKASDLALETVKNLYHCDSWGCVHQGCVVIMTKLQVV